MKWFHNLRTGTKLHLGFGLMVAFIVAMAIIAQTNVKNLQNSMQMLYERDFCVAMELAEFRNLLGQDRANVLLYMETDAGPQQEKLLEEANRANEAFDERIEKLLASHLSDSDLSKRIQDVHRALDAYRDRRAEVLSLIAAGKRDEALLQETRFQRASYDTARDLSVALEKELQQRAIMDVEASAVQSERSYVSFIGIAVGALVFAVSLAFLMNKAIAGPLVRISGVAEKIAAGDLTVEVPGSTRTDEVGMMQTTFGRMVGGLRNLTGQIREATTVLAASATEIMAATSQLASSATETASAVAQTTTTLEEVKQTSQISSHKAKAVSEEARKAAEVAGSGRRSVEQTIEGMEGIQRQMAAIAESIVNLSAQSQAIGEIITSVDDLAAQSKLLAVNASIEAAKAGDDGKGFGVVAQEVKSLAEQSKQATAQVRSILNDIQKATGNAVVATEQGGKAVEAGVSQSARAGESIGALTENIAQAAQAATQIAATSQQQFVGVDQVSLAMESIKVASTQTVASTRQAESAALQLHELGQRLKQLVDQFKV